uniref:SJCHGC09401 protein n=1 Tax=Schistosoma japonicum TaxID=6182 RepID=Q5DCL6_SCHJA|nr:SJCHGC09401 protein [Schistosoma japonicum]
MHSPGIIVGMPFVEAILKESSCEIEWHICEGQPVKSCPVRVATITGANEDIFFCENLVLSVLSRASGIASLASRIQSILQEVSWKGTMYMPDRRTPGFGLVEEYAMMISGISERKSSVSVRCKDMDAGSLKSAIDEVRSRVGSIPVHVACCRLDEACLAAGAGADILLTGLSAKEIVDIASQVKEFLSRNPSLLPAALFDDSDVKLCATRYVDHLTSLKLCNGYAFGDFQMTYVRIVLEYRNYKICPSGKKWSHDFISSHKDQILLDRKHLVVPFLQHVKSATYATNIHITRAPTMLLQPGLNINNQVSGVLIPPNNQQNVNMRLPMIPAQLQQPPQQMPQRMPSNSPTVLGTNQPMGGGFLNSIHPPHNQPPNWQVIPSGPSGHPMGGIGLGMRVSGPGGPNMNNCRLCGFPNPSSMPFCRNCRSGLR